VLSGTTPDRSELAAAESLLNDRCEALILIYVEVVRTALEHLVSLGHRDIAHLDGGSIHGATDRRRSYRTLMRRHDLAQYTKVYPGGNTEADGIRSAELVLAEPRPPTAVIAFNDRSAVGFMFELRRAGVSIPEDSSVVGYDDITMAALPFIDLTTVGQDATATARHAFEHVSGRLEENTPAGNEGLVTPHLAVRSTTAESNSALRGRR
jgi:DNA-binding LacI/PurR family transcriptional regulator